MQNEWFRASEDRGNSVLFVIIDFDEFQEHDPESPQSKEVIHEGPLPGHHEMLPDGVRLKERSLLSEG